LNTDRSADESTDYGLKKEKKERLHTPKPDAVGSSSSPELRKKKSAREEKTEQDYAEWMQEIKALPGNNECADCGLADPEWASINHGVLLCIECSGIHRSLGVHISKVRSITLDRLEPDLLEAMKALGNTLVNSILLGTLDLETGSSGLEVPASRTDRSIKERWIAAKYVERKFVEPPDATRDLNELFYDVCAIGPIPSVLKLILQGAELTWKNPQQGGKTALHNAVINKNSVVTEFLLYWSSEADVTDGLGYSPLHYAASLDHIRIVLLLARRAASWSLAGTDGKTPFDLAQAEQNEDVVMVFRLIEANGGGREALEKTMQLLQARNTRASLRMSQHRVRKNLEVDLLSSSPASDGMPSPS